MDGKQECKRGKVIMFPSFKRRRGVTSGDRERAQDMYDQAAQLEELGNYDEALLLYREAVVSDPEFVAALNNIGVILFNRWKLNEAENFYRRALKASNNTYAMAFYNLGMLLDERGKFDEAAQCYLKAITLQPNYADAHYNLAFLYLGQPGRQFLGIRQLQLFLMLEPIGLCAQRASQVLDQQLASVCVTA